MIPILQRLFRRELHQSIARGKLGLFGYFIFLRTLAPLGVTWSDIWDMELFEDRPIVQKMKDFLLIST